jgi:hypothetical protein
MNVKYSLFQIIVHFGFVLSQTSLTLTKMEQHLEHQISFIKILVIYVLIAHLFEPIDINIFLSENFFKTRVLT